MTSWFLVRAAEFRGPRVGSTLRQRRVSCARSRLRKAPGDRQVTARGDKRCVHFDDDAIVVGGAMSTDPPKLLDQVRGAIRARHYSRRTEEAYVHWIRRYILFHNKRHPKN